MLPALIAGTRIDDAPTPAERLNVANAWTRASVPARSHPADLFYLATFPDSARVEGGIVRDGDLRVGRFSALTGILATTCLLYLTMALARGRIRGLLACLAFAMLPPAAHEGMRLLPENPATLFGAFGTMLLVAAAYLTRPGHGMPRYVPLFGFATVAGAAYGLAAGTLPRAGIHLLVPATLLVAALALTTLRLPRLLRRRSVHELPIRGINRRLLPWGLVFFTTMTAALLTQSIAIEGNSDALQPTLSDVPLLPANAIGSILLIACAVLGAISLMLGVGFRLTRRARVVPDLVLLVAVAAPVLRHVVEQKPFVALPAAPALAVLIGEGLFVLVRLAAFGLVRRAG